jgi:radical SAM protein with 4Fe4S-binding SPASM domain
VFIPDLGDGQQLGRYYDCHGELFGYDRCVSIFHAVELHPNGDMSPCRDYHDFIVGNVNDHTILDLWNSERYRRFRRSINSQGLMPVCSRCCGLMGY